LNSQTKKSQWCHIFKNGGSSNRRRFLWPTDGVQLQFTWYICWALCQGVRHWSLKEVYKTMLQKCLVTKLVKGLGLDVAIGKDNYVEAWSHHYIGKILLELCFLFQCVLSWSRITGKIIQWMIIAYLSTPQTASWTFLNNEASFFLQRRNYQENDRCRISRCCAYGVSVDRWNSFLSFSWSPKSKVKYWTRSQITLVMKLVAQATRKEEPH
jgi:hypothetical protein